MRETDAGHTPQQPQPEKQARGLEPANGADPLELREDPRVGTDLAAEIHADGFGGGLAARARDLSIGGACLATASPFAFKGVQRVLFHLPTAPGSASPPPPLVLDAEGCWQREEPSENVVLTGVRFGDPGEEARERLWRQVLDAGTHIARFLFERCDLHGLGLEDAMGLAQVTRHRSVGAGRTIYRQGRCEPGEDSLFLVTGGSVSLQLRVRDAVERDIAQLGRGDLFGGLPLLTDGVHAESAVAATDCQLLEIDRAAFRYLRTARPWLGQRVGNALMRVSAARLQSVLEEMALRL